MNDQPRTRDAMRLPRLHGPIDEPMIATLGQRVMPPWVVGVVGFAAVLTMTALVGMMAATLWAS